MKTANWRSRRTADDEEIGVADLDAMISAMDDAEPESEFDLDGSWDPGAEPPEEDAHE